MNQSNSPRSGHDSLVATARLWRNIFAAAAAAMAAQVVFILGSPGALVATGVVVILLLAGLALTHWRLQRVLRGSVESRASHSHPAARLP